MIHPCLIGFDIDGVVADTMEAFIRLAAVEHGVTWIKPDHITEFDVEECLDLDSATVSDVFNRLLEEPLQAGLQPMENAVLVLHDLSKFAPLTFVTARPQRKPVEKWLKKTLGNDVCSKARIEAMGEHDGKAEYVKEMGLEYFVDDRAQTCVAMQEKGITSVVYSQPWNRGKHNLMTVDNWLDIRALCME